MEKRIFGLVMLILLSGVTTAYAINQMLEIPAIITVVNPPVITHWVSNVTSFNFLTVKAGDTSTTRIVEITNDSDTAQTLSISSNLPSDMHLLVFNGAVLYTPTLIPSYGTIKLKMSVNVDDGTPDRVTGFDIGFSSI